MLKVERCFAETLQAFAQAAFGKHGQEALEAMGQTYVAELLPDRSRLQSQLQAYAAACDDVEIRAAVAQGYGRLVAFVEQATDLPPQEVARFFATGMLLNVIAAVQDGAGTEWVARLLAGCGKESV